MPLCLFEDAAVPHLYPLTLTRAAGDLRVGARTLVEAQRAAFPGLGALHLAVRPLVEGVAAQEHPGARVSAAATPAEAMDGRGGVLFVNQRWLVRPGRTLDRVRAAVGDAEPRAFFHPDGALLAWWVPEGAAGGAWPPPFAAPGAAPPEGAGEPVEGVTLIGQLSDLLDDLPARIAHDVEAMGGPGEHAGAEVQAGALVVRPERVHLAPGAVVRPGAILSAEDGPIRLEAGAVVEEGAVVRGPCWLGPRAVVKARARVDGAAVGPGSKVGGEVHESVVHSFSNKAHDGYLGNSYLGRWCNLGAGTDTSNLRNDYGEVSLWDFPAQEFLPTGRLFAGLLMADHSKCAIGTTFNTGTVVGVSCNLFGAGFPPRRVPSFSWGGAEGIEPYRLDKALRVAQAVMARRDTPLTDADRALLAAVHEMTAARRAGR